MTRLFSRSAAIGAVCAIAAPVGAINNVWFQTNGPTIATGGAFCSGDPAGVAGTALELFMDTPASSGSCTWSIRLNLDYRGDGNDIGIIGWALDLYTDSTPGKVISEFLSYGSPSFDSANESSLQNA